MPGLVMRRASQLYSGEAKTDRRDSFVIADTARIHQERVHWLAESEEILDELRVLGGYDDDLAHGARILTEIGDVTRFPTAGHLAAYAGLAPITRQSGRSINGEHKSRRSNHRPKNALWLSAFCSLHHPPARDYYARKRSEGKKHNAAVLCLARRRCDLIRKMLTTNATYGKLPARPALPFPSQPPPDA